MQANTPLFSLDLLSTFITVADTRNFTRAAERLNCVQSAVSMQIKKLEDAMQVRLLLRDRRQVHLTDEGRILLAYAQRILRLQREAVSEIEHRTLRGKVRVGASDWSMGYLPKVLKAFKRI